MNTPNVSMDRFVALQQLANRIAPFMFRSSIDTSVRPPLINPPAPDELKPKIGQGNPIETVSSLPNITPDNPYVPLPLINPPSPDWMKNRTEINPIIENLQKIFKTSTEGEYKRPEDLFGLSIDDISNHVEYKDAFTGDNSLAHVNLNTIKNFLGGKGKLQIYKNVEGGFDNLSTKHKRYLTAHEFAHSVWESIGEEKQKEFTSQGLDSEDFANGYVMHAGKMKAKENSGEYGVKWTKAKEFIRNMIKK